MAISIKKIILDDLLARLLPSEKHITVLTGTTSDGWQSTVAWNPVEIFNIPSNATDVSTLQLEEFVSEQQQAGRLLIGYLSYDLGCLLHKVELSTIDDLHTPLVYVLSFENWITFNEGKSLLHTKDNSFQSEVE